MLHSPLCSEPSDAMIATRTRELRDNRSRAIVKVNLLARSKAGQMRSTW